MRKYLYLSNWKIEVVYICAWVGMACMMIGVARALSEWGLLYGPGHWLSISLFPLVLFLMALGFICILRAIYALLKFVFG